MLYERCSLKALQLSHSLQASPLGVGERQLMVLQNTRTGGFAHTPWPAKQVGVCQFALRYGVFECSGKCVLANHAVEGGGPVFSCRYDIVAHVAIRMTKLHKGSVFF